MGGAAAQQQNQVTPSTTAAQVLTLLTASGARVALHYQAFQFGMTYAVGAIFQVLVYSRSSCIVLDTINALLPKSQGCCICCCRVFSFIERLSFCQNKFCRSEHVVQNVFTNCTLKVRVSVVSITPILRNSIVLLSSHTTRALLGQTINCSCLPIHGMLLPGPCLVSPCAS